MIPPWVNDNSCVTQRSSSISPLEWVNHFQTVHSEISEISSKQSNTLETLENLELQTSAHYNSLDRPISENELVEHIKFKDQKSCIG